MNIGILIDVLIICLIGGLVYWVVNFLAPPEPVKKIAVVIVVVVCVVALISLLAGVRGPVVLLR